MPGKLSTHVLDTAQGRPAAGVAVSLWRREGEVWSLVTEATTNSDGRTDSPLLAGDTMAAGWYELRFGVGAYFATQGITDDGTPPFLDEVPVRFRVADPAAAYHVPLLVTPWSYSTYRGS